MEATVIHKFFESLRGKKILVVGDVMIDSYVWGRVDRISPEAPVPIVSVLKREDRLGGAANVALNIASLGAEPILCGLIGVDSQEMIFRKLMHDNLLTDEGIFTASNRPTTVKTRIIGGKQQLLRIDEENSQPVDEHTEELFLTHIQKICKNKDFDAIIFQDYDKGALTPAIINWIIDFGRKNQIPTLVDPKRRNFSAYEGVTLFKPNFKEFCEGLQVDLDKTDRQGIFASAVNFLQKHNIQYLLLTLSELGVMLVSLKEYFVIPAHVRDIADVSGAGDTVISVAALCLAAGMTPYQAAALANLAGGLVCEKVGVVPITRQMLESELLNWKSFDIA
ncbi:MAG: bifunctional ADP-heptose synthase [Bacteroidales bacterium]|nr:bifunctional ADP-heptose synthase [Bacteroidales bacterium]